MPTCGLEFPGKYKNCHFVLKGSFWFFSVLFLVLFSSVFSLVDSWLLCVMSYACQQVETKYGFVVYAFPFSTQVVLLHLEMMAPKKRKRQSIRENAANAVAGAAASAGKTPSQLATWMERVFLLCESACAESDASLSCSWQFKFLWFV